MPNSSNGGMTVVASNLPEEAAWAAFDRSALRLHRLYGINGGSAYSEEQRREAAIETAKRWDEWRKLFLAGGPGEAA